MRCDNVIRRERRGKNDGFEPEEREVERERGFGRVGRYDK